MFRSSTRYGRHALTMALAAAVAGCATTGRVGSDSRRPTGSRDVLTREEIADRAPAARTALDAIRRLRAYWTRQTGTTSFRTQGVTLRVYIDNVRASDISIISAIDVMLVEEIRYFSPPEATSRWGTGHTAGAIEVVTDAPRRTVASPANPEQGDAGEPDTEGPTFVFEPYEPFKLTPMLYLNGASSIVSAPSELGDFWDPGYGFGGGLGLTATRAVTVLAAVDYNSYRFQGDRLISFLERASGSSRLRGREGLEVTGAPLTILNLSGNVKYRPPFDFPVLPYLLGGVGYMRVNAGAFSLTGPDGTDLPAAQFRPGRAAGGDARENSVTVSTGLGFDVQIGESVNFFVDSRYVIGFRAPRYTDVVGVRQLANTQYFPFRLGATIRLNSLALGEY